MNTLIVSGFPGVGKSYFTKEKNSNKILDSDSSSFSWKNTNDRNPDFPNNYIKHIKENIGKVDVIFISTHDILLKELHRQNINYILVYPQLEIKKEYISRYIKRNNDELFIDTLNANYEDWIKGLEEQRGCLHCRLGVGEYISNIIK
jgi:hypothetical protein